MTQFGKFRKKEFAESFAQKVFETREEPVFIVESDRFLVVDYYEMRELQAKGLRVLDIEEPHVMQCECGQIFTGDTEAEAEAEFCDHDCGWGGEY